MRELRVRSQIETRFVRPTVLYFLDPNAERSKGRISETVIVALPRIRIITHSSDLTAFDRLFDLRQVV